MDARFCLSCPSDTPYFDRASRICVKECDFYNLTDSVNICEEYKKETCPYLMEVDGKSNVCVTKCPSAYPF